jgi:hypothetical protein
MANTTKRWCDNCRRATPVPDALWRAKVILCERCAPKVAK